MKARITFTLSRLVDIPSGLDPEAFCRGEETRFAHTPSRIVEFVQDFASAHTATPEQGDTITWTVKPEISK